MSKESHYTGKKGEEYTCAACGGTFIRTWDDSEAEEEFKQKYPDAAAAGAKRVLVCDDCFDLIRQVGCL